MIVIRQDTDPCAAAASGRGQDYQQSFLTPYLRGALTATAIDGGVVLFTTASGGPGSFDLVTSQCLS